ncbi:MAG TPA: hypothetical protein VFP42_07090 [Acidimicrobiia bacterium]|nr:hypothetical protein [Acidimicrobiia bacterium]
METHRIDDALNRAEEAVRSGSGLEGTGFWRAVGQVKRDPDLVDEYADRIAAIDQAAFDNWGPLITIPSGLGTVLAVVATAAGIALVGLAYYLDGFVAILSFGAGVIVLLGSTHSLAHLIVGRVFGIRFTKWFVAKVTQPQPGVKVEYASYLHTRPRRRAWMHAAGAMTTKAIPFLMVPAAIAAGLPDWVWWILLAAGAGMILTDLLWSTKASDWKRFRREMAFAQDS